MSQQNDSAKFAEVLHEELRDIRKRRGEAPTTPTWERILQQARAQVLAGEGAALREIVVAPEAEAQANLARVVARFLQEVEAIAFPHGAEDKTDEQRALREIWNKAIKPFLHETSV